VKLDDPSFPAPIFANLVPDEASDTNYSLIWSRRDYPPSAEAPRARRGVQLPCHLHFRPFAPAPRALEQIGKPKRSHITRQEVAGLECRTRSLIA
jgi:hypothetical protein